MRPILYAPDETGFRFNGIGVLSDDISAEVSCEKNGYYVAEFEYPTTGAWSEYLMPNYQIKTLANEDDAPQIFRICNVRNTDKGTKIIKANHMSYDLLGKPVGAFTASGVANALAAINTNALIPTGFTFDTDMTSSGTYSIATPRSARAILGGSEGSLIDVYGGELKFNNTQVSLLSRIGADNGVTVRYGKNLTDLVQELDSSDSCNGILPFWYSEEDGLVVPDSASTDSWIYGYNYYRTMDLTDKFDSKPTKAQLTALADSIVAGLVKPSQSISVSFVTLHQLKEYETIALLEKVALGDTVYVVYQVKDENGKVKLDINIKTRVVRIVFDSITEKYKTIELGTLKTTIADIMLGGK